MRVLRIIVGAVVSMAVVAPAGAAPPYPDATFLVDYGSFGAHPPSDYRPSVDRGGTRVVFERSFYNGSTYETATYLYVTDVRYHQPKQLYPKVAARADWCWRRTETSDGLISFSTDDGIFVVDPDLSGSLRHLRQTKGLFYPAWYPGCGKLAVKQAVGINGGPSALRIDAASGQVEKLLSGDSIWAGFVSVDPADPKITVFAGQPVGPAVYNENMNYIYRADASTNPPKVRPLDPRTPGGTFNPQFQGRAPTVSPDGAWVAFESNRNCTTAPYIGYYALFLQDIDGVTKARQVTDCSYNAQHARWMPAVPGTNQTVLIAAAYQPGVSPAAFGVAAFDISAFLRR